MNVALKCLLGWSIWLGAATELSAQHVGGSYARTASTVDWQYPAPPAGCDSCISDAEPNAGRHATALGIVAQWHVDRWFGAASEIRFTPKGFAVSQPTLAVDYLEIPLLLRVGRLVHQSVTVSPFAEAGPAIAFRTTCRVRYNSTSEGCYNGAAFGQDWRIRRLDVTAVAGVGVALHVHGNLLMAGERVDWGLRHIGGAEGVPTKHRSLLTYVSWMVPLP
ncbi:MAG: hypothetical protein IPP90_10715 [Gemmatimonadaceae bacterium]|nr:hypothetical protein [Gemmatimonadaceae bacterium]